MNHNNYHVVVAHFNHDISWTKNLKYSYTIISKKDVPKDIWPNKGNEASTYIKYIIDHYYELYEYTIFVHDHRMSWHNKETNLDQIINELKCVKKYNNINELNKQKISLIDDFFIRILEDNALQRSYNLNNHNYKPAAMFYVHRSKIVQYDIEFYIKLYDYIKNVNIDSYTLSRMFEYSWHILFNNDETDYSD